MNPKVREVTRATHDLRGALTPAWMLLQRSGTPSEQELEMVRASVIETMREINEMHTRALTSVDEAAAVVDPVSKDT